MNTIGIFFPMGAGGNHLRWLLLLDSRFTFDHLFNYTGDNSLESKLDFINDTVYSDSRRWFNWLRREGWWSDALQDSGIGVGHGALDYKFNQPPTTGTEWGANKKIFLTTTDVAACEVMYLKFDQHYFAEPSHQMADVLYNLNCVIDEQLATKPDDTLVLDLKLLFKNPLDKELYDKIIAFTGLESHYEEVKSIHSYWLTRQIEAEEEYRNFTHRIAASLDQQNAKYSPLRKNEIYTIDNTNYGTEKLVAIIYPPFASGKFIANLLALSTKFEFQSWKTVGTVVTQEQKIEFLKSKLAEAVGHQWNDLDMGCHELGFPRSFFNGTKKSKTKLDKLSNASNYFVKICHYAYGYRRLSEDWPNMKVIRFMNPYKYIALRLKVENNQFESEGNLYNADVLDQEWTSILNKTQCKNTIDFNTMSLSNKEELLVEVERLYVALALPDFNRAACSEIYDLYFSIINNCDNGPAPVDRLIDNHRECLLFDNAALQ